MSMIKRLLVVFAMVAATVGAVAGPAAADDQWEWADGDCSYNAGNWGSAGYTVTQGGVAYQVYVTPGWQYVGDWTSFCEDINISPLSGYYWTTGIVKARTYMCNSAGTCWYNAWRNCQGGCETATDMADGTKYQVHMYANQSLYNWQIWD